MRLATNEPHTARHRADEGDGDGVTVETQWRTRRRPRVRRSLDEFRWPRRTAHALVMPALPAPLLPAFARTIPARAIRALAEHPVPLTERRVAERFAEAFAPALLISATTLLIALGSAPTTAAGVGWGALAVLFSVLIPEARAWWGAWRDEHSGPAGIRGVRGHRRRPVTFGLAPMVAGMALVIVLDGPREVIALMVAMFGALHAVAAIRRLWQWRPSTHAAVAGGCASALVAVFGAALLAAYLIAAAAGWSRVAQGRRSSVETVAGSVLGILITAPTFLLIA